MALMKAKEMREMRPEDLRAKLKELSDELMHERGVAAMGGAPASPGRIRALRTGVARMHTVMLEQERAAKAKAAPAKKKKAKAAARPRGQRPPKPRKKEERDADMKEEKK